MGGHWPGQMAVTSSLSINFLRRPEAADMLAVARDRYIDAASGLWRSGSLHGGRNGTYRPYNRDLRDT